MNSELNIHPTRPRRKDFRIGIIGSGFIVNDCHLVAYRKAGFNPVAIASRTAERARLVASAHEIPTVYETVEELLDDRSIEVLDIAIPPLFHTLWGSRSEEHTSELQSPDHLVCRLLLEKKKQKKKK